MESTESSHQDYVRIRVESRSKTWIIGSESGAYECVSSSYISQPDVHVSSYLSRVVLLWPALKAHSSGDFLSLYFF